LPTKPIEISVNVGEDEIIYPFATFNDTKGEEYGNMAGEGITPQNFCGDRDHEIIEGSNFVSIDKDKQTLVVAASKFSFLDQGKTFKGKIKVQIKHEALRYNEET
jgi:hypothetical protein